MKRITGVLGFVVVAMSVACSGTSTGSGGGGGGSGGDGTGAGSCSDGSGGTVRTCTDYGAGFNSSAVQQSCAAPKTFSASPCPSTNRVGRCVISITRNGNTATDSVSFYAPTTAVDAKSGCDMENGMNGVTTTFISG